MIFARCLFVCLTLCVVAVAQDGPQSLKNNTARLIGVEREITELQGLARAMTRTGGGYFGSISIFQSR